MTRKKSCFHRTSHIAVLSLLFTSPSILALANTTPLHKTPVAKIKSASNVNSLIPYLGRIEASGTIANRAMISGDGMLPIYGNVDGFVYGDAMGRYAGGNTFVVSPGIGVRQIWNSQIFGAYFFSDYQRTSLKKNFWTISPGIEWANPHWDAHANLYFQTKKSKLIGNTTPYFLSSTGDYSNVSFSGHNQYDTLISSSSYAIIGNGMDGEVGYSFSGLKNLRARAYIGGYNYWPSNLVKNITGFTCGLEIPFSKYLSAEIKNSYDQVNRNTTAISLNLTFGGNSNSMSDDVYDRLLDLVRRHIGIIATGAGTYDQQGSDTQTQTALQYNNVYFVNSITDPDPAGDIAPYENPAQLNQATLDAINVLNPNGALIYVQGGGATYSPAGSLVVHNGQDLYGRTANYTAPASGTGRPLIIFTNSTSGSNDGFDIDPLSSENTFSDLQLAGTPNSSNNGISATNLGSKNESLTINDTNIFGFSNGAYAQNGHSNSASDTGAFTLTAINSQFNDNWASGIYARNDGAGSFTLNANLSQFNYNDRQGTSGAAAGIFAINSPLGAAYTINIVNSQLNGNLAEGFFGENYSSNAFVFTAINSQFNSNWASGILGRNDGSGTFAITAINSQINNNSDYGQGYGGLCQINSAGAASYTLTIVNSQLNNNLGGGVVADNYSYTPFVLTATNSQFYYNTGPGISARNDGSGTFSIDISDSQINNNLNYGLSAINSAPANTFTITLTNSQFNSNEYYGAWIFNYANAPLTLTATNSQFNNNLAMYQQNATGLLVRNDGYGSSTITAINSQFNNNPNGFTTGGGGTSGNGIWAQNSANGENFILTVINSQFLGDGIYAANYSLNKYTLTATNSLFNDNQSGNLGYGIYILNSGSSGGSGTASEFTLNVTNSQFNNNFLGGIWAGNEATGQNAFFMLTATDSTFIGNGIGSQTTVYPGAGLYIENRHPVGDFNVLDTSGSSFSNNAYGIYGFSVVPNTNYGTTIDYAGSSFLANVDGNTSQTPGDNINWISS